MSRARIAALALVNWKGVFYERYLLDRHVTALEGMNGAGKTTVMIAAYVALLPDMSKLRFTNLGETAATGGDRGIWGRLGEEGRPSYTVLDVECGDQSSTRVLAGVRLTRLAEPTVEPTAFIVTGLPSEQRLSDLLLVRRLDGDHVPDLDEIRAAVEAAGGTLTTFRAIKDYFAELFERGITPMRLAGDEERSKLNEMLRTSMTGGISRALTSELRGFLLKEETGLADTLSRMRSNLDACARTRSEVIDARRLEREIASIYEAGMEMFSASVRATRTAAIEAERDVQLARPLVDDALRAHRAIEELLEQQRTRTLQLAERLESAQTDHGRAVAERDRRLAAQTVAARLVTVEEELSALVVEEARCRAAHAAATTSRSAARLERTRAHDAYDRASRGLADLQVGIDELVRRAHGHRQLTRRLDDARRLLARPALTPDDAPEALAEFDGERTRLETECARTGRDGRDLATRRQEYAAATQALAVLEPVVDDTNVHGRARAALARTAEREASRARMPDLERERAEAAQLATRQVHARALVAQLGLALDGDATSRVVGALETVEREVREAELRSETARAKLVARQQRGTSVRDQLAALDGRSARWHLASATIQRLACATAAGALTDRAELAALRDRLTEELHGLDDKRTQLEAQRQALHERATAIEHSGTNIDPELLRLRDELGGELLASRFEDLDLASASWVEAKLGPLTDALIVDDLDAAIVATSASERHAPNVWLVSAGSVLGVDPPEDIAELDEVGDVVSVESFGARVTRRRPRPSLGRRARERAVHELHESIARAATELDEVAARSAQILAWRRDLDAVASELEVLAAGDPADEHARLLAELAAIEHEAATADEAAHLAREALGHGRTRLEALRRLLPAVSLLDGPDHAARATALAAQLAELAISADDLARQRAAGSTLAELLDVLRAPPPDDDAVAAQAARTTALVARLDELAVARAALEDVLEHRHAAAFGDAEAALDARSHLAPALEAQHVDARGAVEAASAAEALAEAAWEVATQTAQAAEANRLAALAHRDRVASELAALGTPVGDAVVIDPDALAERVIEIDCEARELVGQHAVTAERHDRAVRTIEDARTRLAIATQAAGPAVAEWTALRESAQADGVLHAALVGPRTDHTSIQLVADAWGKRELLVDRVTRTRGGDEIAAELRGTALDGLGYLAAWRTTREWLRRRVPVQVADVDEPLLALERLRDHLDVLERRLARQEHDLRGASEDVARGIDVQVRRAHGQVRRLNGQLDGIAFGSIRGIRVEIRRIERMEQILRALRLGEAQELLFTPAVPIEEALDEIFRRYGGGGRGGGQRLLDYREYLELGVEIRRRSAEEWEVASPTKLSTGEAIGVGAALMMVVLTEWERDANLLRERRTGGSLRFLFLDEANRLSRDNLGVLFDLCKSLDLQLLIAAPEVARAEGNTTYRLVRHVTAEGREEVIVSGRRSIEQPASEPVSGASPDEVAT